ncbi:hypothetical protein DZE40_002630 [Clostridium beijerinckii]|uniref:Uncharacterized protein n=1 Tax=Clostridium beijerinckii TaxID=1520 RepID=A0A1S8RZ27_CLOBE|nr:hypothetical protein [Clostridium beijerinckii]OOM58466.1 hypothetical protein CLBCK_40440 [Clostridium beijerinckii]
MIGLRQNLVFFLVFKNTTSLTSGSGKLLAISRKKINLRYKIIVGLPTETIKYKDVCQLIDIDSLAHSK